MARIYLISEPEMQGLIDQLKLERMKDLNILIHPDEYNKLTPEEKNRLNGVHRAFHLVCVRWAQKMGFTGALT